MGERWALLVVREIAMGSTRFSDIVRGTGAPRDRIAARLKALEAAGVVRCESGSGARHTYRLTEAGAELVPVLNALLAWGEDHAVAADDPKRAARYRKLPTPETTIEEDR
ncbi:helix-turn-helix domain-containing protein [Williamsia sp.]|uniref:winged helix-turn-helix transcriptional regulator n=1 Tax=Williamsia sp. TaxID=1872085 RepID=UPI002F957391